MLTVVSNIDRSVELVSEYLLTQGLVGEYGWDGHGSQASPERCEHTLLLNKLETNYHFVVIVAFVMFVFWNLEY